MEESSQAEVSLLFEMVDSSLSLISVGDQVVFPDKVFESMIKAFDNAPMEVLDGDGVEKIKSDVNKK